MCIIVLESELSAMYYVVETWAVHGKVRHQDLFTQRDSFLGIYLWGKISTSFSMFIHINLEDQNHIWKVKLYVLLIHSLDMTVTMVVK